ncbi:MAG: dephospho-CoA kinase [Planctomycetota bacterium]|jgi:dephospho-CoA kinase|nr:dephospho-CoA kinase [Planctomycetota bacterium]
MAAPAAPLQGSVIIGITGGIGAGKSSAAKHLVKSLDALLLDADAIVGELLQAPQILADIEVALESTVTTGAGSVDRAMLSALIFHDDKARAKVERILHPAVRQRIWQALADYELEKPGGVAILDIPLLREAGLDHVCDRVLHVAVLGAERCRRACSRHGWTEAQWQSREDAQMPVDRKEALADAIVHNDAGPAALLTQVHVVAESFRCLAPRPLSERWPSWDNIPTST